MSEELIKERVCSFCDSLRLCETSYVVVGPYDVEIGICLECAEDSVKQLTELSDSKEESK